MYFYIMWNNICIMGFRQIGSTLRPLHKLVLPQSPIQAAQSTFYIEEMNVYEMWKQKVNSKGDEVRNKELCKWRDKCDCTFLTKDECQTILMIFVQIKFIYVSF